MFNVIPRKHICKNKFCIRTDTAQNPGSVCLCILYTAAGPANAQVKIIDHSYLLWKQDAKFFFLIHIHIAQQYIPYDIF